MGTFKDLFFPQISKYMKNERTDKDLITLFSSVFSSSGFSSTLLSSAEPLANLNKQLD